MSIIDISIKRPLFIIVVFVTIIMLGAISYFGLNINLTPKMEIPVVLISTVYPGAAATEVESSVTKKIEDQVSSIENLKRVTSKSYENVSVVIAELYPNTNTNIALQEVQRKINAIKSTLPDEIKDPSLNKFSLDDMPVIKIGVTSTLPETEFYRLVDEKIKNQLAKIRGVGIVSLSGGAKREIQLNVNPQKLKEYKLSILQVIAAIQSSNMDIPAGKVETIENTYSIRLEGKYSSMSQIENTRVATSADGSIIRLKDVAEIRDGVADITTINRINGINSIGLQIVKQQDANTVVVCDLVKEELKKIEKEFEKENVKFTVAIDASIYTKASVNSVIEDLILAIIIVSLVCFMFLHSIRNAIIVMISVPLSMMPALIVMYLLGYSLNIMSLMALSLVVGILVDDSIVVIENMYRFMEMGKSRLEAALLGCKQIMFTASAITLVIVVVFLPLAIASGTIGNMLREFATPLIVSTLTSLLVSFTLTPMLVSKFGKLEDLSGKSIFKKISRGFEKGYNSIKNYYVRILEYSFKRKGLLFAAVLILFIATLALLPMGFIGVSMMSTVDQGEFDITIEMSAETPVYQNNLQIAKIEEFLLNKPEIIRVFSSIGSTSSVISTTEKNYISQLTVKMVDKKDRTIGVEKYADQIKQELNKIPGIKVTAAVSSIMGASTAPIQVILTGNDLSKIQLAADTAKKIMKNIPGTSDVKFSIDDSKPEIHVDIDRSKMNELSISVYDVGATLRTAMAGNTDYKYTETGYDYNINIIVDKFNKQSVQDIASLAIMNNKGELIEIQQFAKVYQSIGPSMLERYNRVSSISVNSFVVGRATGTVGSEIKEALKGRIPDGVNVFYGGQMESQDEAFGTLFSSLGIAIILVYLIMVALYDSAVYPFVVLFSIPLAIIGAILALALTMNELNIFAIIGLIMLIGLVAKNAILLVDFTNQLRREGKSVKDALLEAGAERLRPIIMTTLAMVFGMLPVAIASGAGAEMKNGMAWVIIGGLISSLVLTLIVVPNVYLIVENTLEKFRKKSKNEPNEKVIPASL